MHQQAQEARLQQEVNKRAEEIVAGKMEQAEAEVHAVPNVLVLLARLQAGLDKFQQHEERQLELIALVSMTLESLQECQKAQQKTPGAAARHRRKGFGEGGVQVFGHLGGSLNYGPLFRSPI